MTTTTTTDGVRWIGWYDHTHKHAVFTIKYYVNAVRRINTRHSRNRRVYTIHVWIFNTRSYTPALICACIFFGMELYRIFPFVRTRPEFIVFCAHAKQIHIHMRMRLYFIHTISLRWARHVDALPGRRLAGWWFNFIHTHTCVCVR